MLPATDIPRFRLDRPNQGDEEVLRSLRHLGDAIALPRLLVKVTTDYLRRYTRPDGTPDFSGGSYFVPGQPDAEPSEEQLQLDVVESFALSIPLMLAALGFAKVFRNEVADQPELTDAVDVLQALANRRLSAAMVGLLRSFSISVFEADHPYGKALIRTVNQTRQANRRVLEGLREELQDIAAGLRDLNIGLERVSDLDQAGRLFECGWSWGITKGAPRVITEEQVGVQRDGYALDSPYLYFTVVALDGINELYSERTRRLGLLTDDQQKLASTLRLRFDLTQQYWAKIASYGTGRWPLEDIPWRAVDERESDYFSLLVTSIAARDLAVRRDTDDELGRLGQVLVELANRGRLTRRLFENDLAVNLHHPGVAVDLEGTEAFGTPLTWVATDFAPLLLKRSIYIASQINDIELRSQLLQLADVVWEHVAQRRMRGGPGQNLWDQPAHVFDGIRTQFKEPSWHHTLRVVESLVLAANLVDTVPLRSENLANYSRDLLAEAEHLLDQELLAGSAESASPMRKRIETVSNRVQRSREIMEDRPASATALLMFVLKDLDDLAAARPDRLGE